MKGVIKYYWFFVALLQLYIIYMKIEIKEDFYIYNIGALVCSVVFLYYRIKLNRIVKASESIIILFMILSSFAVLFYQIVIPKSFVKLIGAAIVGLVSVFVMIILHKPPR